MSSQTQVQVKHLSRLLFFMWSQTRRGGRLMLESELLDRRQRGECFPSKQSQNREHLRVSPFARTYPSVGKSE